MAAKKAAPVVLKDLKMVFGKDVHWLAEGPSYDRVSDHKGASVELQGDYDREDGLSRALVFVAKNGTLAQATFKPGRDIMFSHEMDNETSDKAWKLADQLVAILDIRKAVELVAGKKSAQIDLKALRSAVDDLDPAYIPRDQLISLHDDLARLGARVAPARAAVLKVIRAQSDEAARELVKSALHIRGEFAKVAKGDDSAVDDMLDGLTKTFEKIDGDLPFLRREFLNQAAAGKTTKALGQVAQAMDSLTGGFKTVFGSFGDRVKAQARTLGVS